MSSKIRFFLFSCLLLLTIGLVYPAFKELLATATRREYYSHILLIPLVSTALLFGQRKNVFEAVEFDLRKGLILLALGLLFFLIGKSQKGELSLNDYAALMALSGVIFGAGAFIFCFGQQALRKSIFPFLFLIFMIPLPMALMDKFIYILQVGSAEFTHLLFRLTGVPVLRDGFTFTLPNLQIEVAKECSGIRSSLALLITSVLAGHLFLKSGWKKLLLTLSIFPITVFKNGVRIVVLSLLGAYVDPRILGSELHRSGGIPFFFIALLLLAPVLWFLRKWEKNRV